MPAVRMRHRQARRRRADPAAFLFETGCAEAVAEATSYGKPVRYPARRLMAAANADHKNRSPATIVMLWSKRSPFPQNQSVQPRKKRC